MSQADFTPTISEATRPYWEATKARRLVLQRCVACTRYVHHPREACPRCLGQDFDWVESMGRGSIHAMSVHHRPFGAMSLEDCPYIVAFIDLDEGVRFLANVVDTDDRSVTRGDAVVLTWKPVANGYNLPAFKPAPR